MTPSFLEPNLAALHRWLPRVADRLASTPIPPDWQPTAGTDATATYCRREIPDDPLCWLGRTSMPAASAAPLVANMTAATGIGLGIGTGYEWLTFLNRLTSDQLIYVFEPDPVQVRLALTICTMTAALDAGRILLLTGPDAAQELAAFLENHPGFEPPSVIHPLPTIDPAQRNTLLAQAESMVRQAVTQRAERTTQAIAQLNSQPAPTDPERRLVLSLQQDGPTQRPLRAAMEACARSHPDKVKELLLDHHSSASLLARINAALQHHPAVITSDLFRSQLGPCIPPHAFVETWIPPTPHYSFWFTLPAAVPSPTHDRIICHNVEHQDLLQSANMINVRIVPIAIPAVSIPTPSIEISIRHTSALLGDLPSMDPEAHGLKLPSHTAVWNAARDLILEDPLAVHTAMLPDLFRRAQARCGVEIVEPQLVDSLNRGIRHVLAVSGVAIGLAKLLCDAGLSVRCIGSGWNTPQITGLPLQIIPTPAKFSDLQNLWQGVSILLHYNTAGTVDPLLLHAATADVALIAPEHPRQSSPGGLATLLEPAHHFLFPSRRNTLQTTKDLTRDSAKRKSLATAARAHIIAHHTWDHRIVHYAVE